MFLFLAMNCLDLRRSHLRYSLAVLRASFVFAYECEVFLLVKPRYTCLPNAIVCYQFVVTLSSTDVGNSDFTTLTGLIIPNPS